MDTKQMLEGMTDETLKEVGAILQAAVDAECESEDRYDLYTALIVEITKELEARGYGKSYSISF